MFNFNLATIKDEITAYIDNNLEVEILPKEDTLLAHLVLPSGVRAEVSYLSSWNDKLVDKSDESAFLKHVKERARNTLGSLISLQNPITINVDDKITLSQDCFYYSKGTTITIKKLFRCRWSGYIIAMAITDEDKVSQFLHGDEFEEWFVMSPELCTRY